MTNGPKHRRDPRLHRKTRAVAATAAFVLLAGTAALAAPGVTPSATEASLSPGDSAVYSKSVEAPTIAPTPDILFLADTTGSMGGALANVQANVSDIIADVRAEQPNAWFGAAQYKDVGDAIVYNLDSPVTGNDDAVTTAVNSWAASGGGDTPEAQISALYHLGTDTNVGWRDGSSRIVVWFGDAPGHDPSQGRTRADAISALQSKGIRVIAIDVGALDSTGQATAIADATGGVVLPASGDVSAAILDGLQSLDATITPTIEDDTCAAAFGESPALSVSWEPNSVTLTSEEIEAEPPVTADFTETITVSADAEPGIYDCQVTFEVNGGSGPEFVESNSIEVVGGGDAPGAPTLNQALAGNQEVGLNWSPPDSEGDSPITKYTVYADPCPSGGGGGDEFADLSPAACVVLDDVDPTPNANNGTFNYIVGGLTNGVTYTFAVTASNDGGEGPSSNELSATPTDSADTSTIGDNGRGTVDTGFAGGANSNDPSCAPDPSSADCRNVVARYSLVDRKNAGAVISLSTATDAEVAVDENMPGGPIACLTFNFLAAQVSTGGCHTVADKTLLSIYPATTSTLLRPHFAFEQNDASVTTLELGAPCFELVTNANGTPKLATNGDPICKSPNFPRIFGSGPVKTNMCPYGVGWTRSKPCAYIYYKVERIPGYNLSPADCAATWPNCSWGTLSNPKARRPVACSTGPTCGKEVVIGSTIRAGIKLTSGQYAVRPWCQGPQSRDDREAPFIKWLPCDLYVEWVNNVRSTSVHYNDMRWVDLEVNDPGGKRTG